MSHSSFIEPDLLSHDSWCVKTWLKWYQKFQQVDFSHDLTKHVTDDDLSFCFSEEDDQKTKQWRKEARKLDLKLCPVAWLFEDSTLK